MKIYTEKPEYNPVCCNRLAEWIVQFPALCYWYCYECHKEVPTYERPVEQFVTEDSPKERPHGWVTLPPGFVLKKND